jgi:hypothetical protein
MTNQQSQELECLLQTQLSPNCVGAKITYGTNTISFFFKQLSNEDKSKLETMKTSYPDYKLKSIERKGDYAFLDLRGMEALPEKTVRELEIQGHYTIVNFYKN